MNDQINALLLASAGAAKGPAPAASGNNNEMSSSFQSPQAALLQFLQRDAMPHSASHQSSAGSQSSLIQALLEHQQQQRQREEQEKILLLQKILSGNTAPQPSADELALRLLQQRQLQNASSLGLMAGSAPAYNPLHTANFATNLAVAQPGSSFDQAALARLLQAQQSANAVDVSTVPNAVQNLDAAAAAVAGLPAPGERRRKGRTGTFPQKMHQMLSDLERQEGGVEIASFLPHGRAFAIHKPRDFVKHVMPKYFRMSRFSSFQRQLNLYDFQRISEGPDKGSYYHELFVQGRPILSTMMKRNKIKGVKNKQNEAVAAISASAATEHADAADEDEVESKDE